MFRRPLQGHLEVICGSMFSGKTEELMRRLRRAQIAKQRVQVFKPGIDNRYSEDHVQSHDSNRLPSINVSSSEELLRRVDDNVRTIGIDEAQFLDKGLVDVVQKLAYRGIRVIIAGLDTDFKGRPFGPMPELLAVAEEVTKLKAVCMECSFPATRSQRVTLEASQETEETIAVGAQELYEARCRFCHDPQPLVRSLPLHPSLTSETKQREGTHGTS